LKHENIASTMAGGVDAEGFCYVVEEFILGLSIAELVSMGSKLGPLEATRIIRGLAGGLAKLLEACEKDKLEKPHEVDPAQGFVGFDGKIKYTDPSRHLRTQRSPEAERLWGYASPESLRAGGNGSGEPALVFSLATMLWELCSGRRLFPANTREEAKDLIAYPVVDRLSEVISNFPLKLDEILQTSLSKAPGERFATLAAFASALGTVSGKTSSELALSMQRQFAAEHSNQKAWLAKQHEALSVPPMIPSKTPSKTDTEEIRTLPLERLTNHEPRVPQEVRRSTVQGFPAVPAQVAAPPRTTTPQTFANDTIETPALFPDVDAAHARSDTAAFAHARASSAPGAAPAVPKHLLARKAGAIDGRYTHVAEEKPDSFTDEVATQPFSRLEESSAVQQSLSNDLDATEESPKVTEAVAVSASLPPKSRAPEEPEANIVIALEALEPVLPVAMATPIALPIAITMPLKPAPSLVRYDADRTVPIRMTRKRSSIFQDVVLVSITLGFMTFAVWTIFGPQAEHEKPIARPSTKDAPIAYPSNVAPLPKPDLPVPQER
jgi:hypothetical protein